jgi:hypothetical protein
MQRVWSITFAHRTGAEAVVTGCSSLDIGGLAYLSGTSLAC